MAQKKDELSEVDRQLTGVPVQHLIGAPLVATCQAQMQLAESIYEFIEQVGFDPVQTRGVPTEPGRSTKRKARQVEFSMTRPSKAQDGTINEEKVDMSVPLLSIVPIPNLQVSNLTVDFQMTVETQQVNRDSFDLSVSTDTSSSDNRNTSLTANSDDGDGNTSSFNRSNSSARSFALHGQVASHHDQTRSTDTSAKYSFHVEAKQMPPSEGLLKVLDILASACAPKALTLIPTAQPKAPAAVFVPPPSAPPPK